jgi:hypothetical protein
VLHVLVLYRDAPDPERYAAHAELCRAVPGATFSHGRVFATPVGEPAYAYAAEWRFPDREAFDAATRSAEFAATGRDAAAMGLRFSVHFAESA